MNVDYSNIILNYIFNILKSFSSHLRVHTQKMVKMKWVLTANLFASVMAVTVER